MGVRADRAGMLAGIAFPILLAVGVLVELRPAPDTSKGTGAQVAQGWLKTLNDKGDRTDMIVGSFLMILASLALIWFATALRGRFAATAGNPMGGFALLAAVGIAVSTVGPLAVAGGHSFGNEPLPTDGAVVWFLTDLMFPSLLVIFGLASAAFIATLLITAKGALPTWLVVFGWVAVVAGVVGVLFLPIVLMLLWYLAAAIHGVVRSPAAAEPAAAA